MQSIKLNRRSSSLLALISTVIFVFVLGFISPVHADEGSGNTGLAGMPSGVYPVDLSHASVVWKVSHFGFSTYVGRFTDFSADLNLNSNDFTKSSVQVSIATDSISTAYPFADEKDFNNILATDWLKSNEYPNIVFKSTSVSPMVNNQSDVAGELTIAGQTHPVVLNVTLNKFSPSHPLKQVPVIGFSAITELDRTVWGVSKYVPAVGANVAVEIEGEFLMEK